ncbi:MAG: insulinase family protein, partial [Gammaproteobacteria bacterium]
GDPAHIPDLSYQQLLDFYKSHYHPSNAVFMTFGDIPVSELHQEFEQLALAKFDRLDEAIAVHDEKRYSAPISVEEFYAVEEADKENKTHVVVGWLLGHSTNLEELFKAQLLSSVLLDTSASPLLHALETTDLGTAPSPMCGLEDSSREMSFMAGLEGCKPDATELVERLVLETLESIKINGIPEDQLEAALHQLELNQREISGDAYPYGLQLILTSLSTAIHRGDAIQVMDIDPVLENLRKQIKDPGFIPQLIDELLLENAHRVTLTLRPDKELNSRKAAAEKARLSELRKTLSDQDVGAIVARARQLAQRQQQADDPGLLPKVGLEDVPESISEPQREDLQLPGSAAAVSHYSQGTNGLAYQQVVFSLPAIADDLLAVLPLYTSCISELGVGEKDYTAVQTWQARISGGLNCFTRIRGGVDDEQSNCALLTFSSKSLSNNHGELSKLIHETIASVRFDEDRRVQELIEQICARKENSITQQGHSLAMSLASSGMSPSARLAHRSGGLLGISNLRKLRAKLASAQSRQDLLRKFAQIHTLIQQSPRQFLLIGEAEERDAMVQDLARYWAEEMPRSTKDSFSLPPVRQAIREIWTTTTQVNFCAQAFPTVSSSHEDNAVLHVLAGYLRNGFLHRAIREKGGAYGAGASQDANAAAFRFFSYRDPRLTATFDDFAKAVDWIIEGKHPANLLEEAILGVISSMDKPSSPAGEAKQAFYNYQFGRTPQLREAFRHRVLETSEADLRSVAQRYLVPETASLGIITNKESVDSLAELHCKVINM